jgi:diguanylate cyclase (GGDEF)-like protein/PAS domain S-box-containing protein
VSPSGRLDPADLDVVLATLLAEHPHAPVVAVNPNGLFIPMPSSLALAGRHVIEGHASTLQLVVTEDVNVVIETWTQARMTGAARGTVRLTSDPERWVGVHYVDAMHSHGMYVGLFEVESSDQLLAALGDAPMLRPRVAVIHKDEMAFIRGVDEATSHIVGWSAEEMIGHRSLEFIDPQDHARSIENWMDMLRTPGARRRVRLRHRHKNGSWVWFEVTNHNLRNDPAHGYILTEMVDITDEMAAQEALRAREHLLRRLTEALPLGVFQVDTARSIVYRNARLATILGNKPAASLDKQLANVLPADRPKLKQALNAVLIEGRDVDLEVALRRSTNDIRRCTFSLRVLTDDSGTITGAIVSVTDVTETVRLREELEDRATFDELTRRHNRASILQVLERTLADQPNSGAGTGAIFVDLDHFKEINDRFGHAAGDVLLVEVAQRLGRAVRGFDVVGRLGGDEFLVVCSRVENSDEALRIAERIADALGATDVQLGDTVLTPSASIGVAWSNRAGMDADALVALADLAMYESKRQRQGRPVLFSGQLKTAA